MHGFEWYLSQPGLTCDSLCSEPTINGQNFNINASNSWTDYCFSGTGRETDVGQDVASWMLINGNPGDWTELWRYPSGPTSYFTLGYGYPGGRYFHKCSSGSEIGSGSLIGDVNNDPDRQNICACNLGPLYEFGLINSQTCTRGYSEVATEEYAREAANSLDHPPTSDFLQDRSDRPRGAYMWGNISYYFVFFNRRLATDQFIRGTPICRRNPFDQARVVLEGNGCFSGLTHRLGTSDTSGSLNLLCNAEGTHLQWRTYNLDRCMGPGSLELIPLVETGRRLVNGRCERRGNLFVKLNRKISDTHLRHMQCPFYRRPYGNPSLADFRVTQGCRTGGGTPADQPSAYWWLGERGCIASQEWGPEGAVSDVEFFTFRCDCPNTYVLKWDGEGCTGNHKVVFWDSWANFQTLLGLRRHCYGNGTLGTMLDKPLSEVPVLAAEVLPFWQCPLPGTIPGQPEACGVPSTTTITTMTTTSRLGQYNSTTRTTSTSTTCVHCYFNPTATATATSTTTPEAVVFPNFSIVAIGYPNETRRNPNNVGVSSAAMRLRSPTSWLVALLAPAAALFAWRPRIEEPCRW